MLGDPKTSEWRLLKDQFDALVHDEGMREDSVEMFFDDQIRRRFIEWINWAVEQTENGIQPPARIGAWQEQVPSEHRNWNHRAALTRCR